MGSHFYLRASRRRLRQPCRGGRTRAAVFEALRALGLRRITCVHDRPNWAAPLVDDWIEADSVAWSPPTLDAVRSQVSDLDGVMTYDDYSVIVAAHLAKGF